MSLLFCAARGLTKSFGGRIRGRNTKGFRPATSEALSPQLQVALALLLSALEAITARVSRVRGPNREGKGRSQRMWAPLAKRSPLSYREQCGQSGRARSIRLILRIMLKSADAGPLSHPLARRINSHRGYLGRRRGSRLVKVLPCAAVSSFVPG